MYNEILTFVSFLLETLAKLGFMVLVSSFGVFTLAVGWWYSRQLSSRFLKVFMFLMTLAIVVMSVWLVWLSVERSRLEFEIPFWYPQMGDDAF